MNTIHTFGDSFTFGYGCVENCSFTDYYEYKKEEDNIWPNHLGNKLGMNVINHGKSGFCNEQIFDSIIKNFDSINENDIIIIEKTHHGRLSVPNDSEWISTLSIEYTVEEKWKNKIKKIFSDEEIETLINFQYYFSPKKLYEKRNNDRFDFIKKILLDTIKVKDNSKTYQARADIFCQIDELWFQVWEQYKNEGSAINLIEIINEFTDRVTAYAKLFIIPIIKILIKAEV